MFRTSASVSAPARRSAVTFYYYHFVTKNNHSSTRACRKFATGSRGSRGHGWFVNYRSGKGGRHLQGQFYEKEQQRDKLVQWNDAVMNLGGSPTRVYMDVSYEKTSAFLGGDGGPDIERLYIDMNPILMPKVCENFLGLLSNISSSENDETAVSYKGSNLYRIEKKVGICGGDVVTNNGKMGRCLPHLSSSINSSNNSSHPLMMDLGYEPFYTTATNKNNNNTKPRTEPSMAYYHLAGTVSMLCSHKVNCIDSRFIMLTNDSFHLDGYHIPFGKLCDKSLATVQEWEKNVVTQNAGIPSNTRLSIVGGGILKNDYDVKDTEKRTDDDDDKDNVEAKQVSL